jgi:hypothetical protein
VVSWSEGEPIPEVLFAEVDKRTLAGEPDRLSLRGAKRRGNPHRMHYVMEIASLRSQ